MKTDPQFSKPSFNFCVSPRYFNLCFDWCNRRADEYAGPLADRLLAEVTALHARWTEKGGMKERVEAWAWHFKLWRVQDLSFDRECREPDDRTWYAVSDFADFPALAGCVCACVCGCGGLGAGAGRLGPGPGARRAGGPGARGAGVPGAWGARGPGWPSNS